MTPEASDEYINGLAEAAAQYLKALTRRNVPFSLAAALVRDWQAAWVQDGLDARYRTRREGFARPFRIMDGTIGADDLEVE